MQAELKRWLSRKLILSLVAAVVTFGNSYWNWGLKTEEVAIVVSSLLSYIVVEGIADIKERGHEGNREF